MSHPPFMQLSLHQLDHGRPEKWTGQFTTELLELLWALEATAGYLEQAKLLEAVVAGKCFKAGEPPAVSDEARKPPGRHRALDGDLFELAEKAKFKRAG